MTELTHGVKVGVVLKTREGLDARIIATDARIGGGGYNIVALIRELDGNDFIEWYKSSHVVNEPNGPMLICDASEERSLALIEVTPS